MDRPRNLEQISGLTPLTPPVTVSFRGREGAQAVERPPLVVLGRVTVPAHAHHHARHRGSSSRGATLLDRRLDGRSEAVRLLLLGWLRQWAHINRDGDAAPPRAHLTNGYLVVHALHLLIPPPASRIAQAFVQRSEVEVSSGGLVLCPQKSEGDAVSFEEAAP